MNDCINFVPMISRSQNVMRCATDLLGEILADNKRKRDVESQTRTQV